MIYAGIDPGGMTGFADFEDGTPFNMGEIPCRLSFAELYKWLRKREDFDYFIVENYRNRPVGMTRGHANTWSQNLESKIIGACDLFCDQHGIKLVLQEPSIKPVGYGMAGLKYVPNKKGTHMYDSIAHGSYWWMNTGRKLVVPK